MEIDATAAVTYSEYRTITLEAVLAYVGGIQGLLLSLIGSCIGGYQEFRFKRSLVKTFYSLSHSPGGKDINKSEPNNDELLEKIKKSERVPVSYFDSFVVSFASCFCPCKRDHGWFEMRQKRLDAQEEAFRRMNNEIDLLNIITLLR